MIAAANAAPESILPGSKLTFGQALQTQRANTPGAQMLERIVAGGPGGDALLKRYAQQGENRIQALKDQGAETYQGAAAEEKTALGNRIGATIRTQVADEKTHARAVWEALHKRAADEGVALNLPLNEIERAMGTLGPGTVGAGATARSVANEAQRLGTTEIEAIKPMTQAAGGKAQTLEQAVRSAGGIKSNDRLTGELGDLRIKGSGTTGLVMRNGKPADLLAEMMHERGFIPDADPATLFEALRNGGGRKVFANDAPEAGYQAMFERAMGDAPEAVTVPRALPFEEFQRLRRSAGALAAKVGEKTGGEVEGSVLNKISELLTKRADSVASGGALAGDVMSPEFGQAYNSARDLTRRIAELYKQNNNIGAILRRPVGQDYALTGDEISNKIWHGGAGLAGDVSNLKRLLTTDTEGPVMNALQKLIMTDAASKTTAAGSFGAALPKYVESRMAGLGEALTPDQFTAISQVAKDIRNAEAAAAVPGLRGSDTQAKITRALDAGLLDGPAAKTLMRFTNFKGIGLEPLRARLSETIRESKGKTIAALLADPKAAAKALQEIGGSNTDDLVRLLQDSKAQQFLLRSAPVAVAQ
jgi:hypothetical protein